MRILYVSSFNSSQRTEELKDCFKVKILNAQAQKFHSLITEGLRANGFQIDHLTTCSHLPKLTQKKFINGSKQVENGMDFFNLPVLFVPFLQFLFAISVSFLFVFKWITTNKRNEIIIVCDVVEVFQSIGTLLAAKILRVPTVAIVTDLPGNLVSTGERTGKVKNILINLYKKLTVHVTNSFDKYVLLTVQMNKIVNSRNKENIIVEGIVNKNMDLEKNEISKKYKKKVILFAGHLEKVHGIHLLVDAFAKTVNPNYELHIYGKGGAEEYVKNKGIEDPRIKFFGMVDNSIIIKEEMKATLLVNPRFSSSEFTEYSFPSKNMEYMVSGTAVLTTKLPGMPIEYYNFVKLIEDETVDGLRKAIEDIMAIPMDELHFFGLKAKEFVLKNKNHEFQCARIKKMIIQ